MKKALFPLILIVAAVVLSAVITSWVVTADAQKEGGLKAGLLGMQMEFMRNNSILRPITDHEKRPDLQKYLNEVNTLMSWYFKNPASKFWAQYPELRALQGRLRPVQERQLQRPGQRLPGLDSPGRPRGQAGGQQAQVGGPGLGRHRSDRLRRLEHEAVQITHRRREGRVR
jgi:hypothetical protein